MIMFILKSYDEHPAPVIACHVVALDMNDAPY